jgi:hypothetical protein
VSKRICYNCGSDQADTAEHVIAKALIPEPRPDNLITVSACRACNEGFSKDEEYLRDRLSAVVGTFECGAPKTWDVAWRSMQRSEAQGKKLGFFKDVFKLPISVEIENGLSDTAIQINKGRANRVVEKMIRGFYFYHFNKPLGDVEFQMDILSSINPTGDRDRLIPVVRQLYDSPTWAQNFGPDTHVACMLAEDDDRAGLWGFKLLGRHILLALVTPKLYFDI